jgi:hypothetical protein
LTDATAGWPNQRSIPAAPFSSTRELKPAIRSKIESKQSALPPSPLQLLLAGTTVARRDSHPLKTPLCPGPAILWVATMRPQHLISGRQHEKATATSHLTAKALDNPSPLGRCRCDFADMGAGLTTVNDALHMTSRRLFSRATLIKCSARKSLDRRSIRNCHRRHESFALESILDCRATCGAWLQPARAGRPSTRGTRHPTFQSAGPP